MKQISKKQINEYIEKFKKDKQIIAVLLFGSYARKEYYRDVDLCLVLDKKYSNKEMIEKLIYYSGRMADIIDLKIFQLLPIYIKKEILKDGKILFCNDYSKLYDIAYETINEYEDFKDIYKDYIKNALKK